MRDDLQLQRAVMHDLALEPTLDAARIGVAASDEVVTLTGTVGSYAERLLAERIAMRGHQVRGVANDLAVELHPGRQRTDTEITVAAVHALERDPSVPGNVTVSVTKGYVTLGGTVDWPAQREAAEAAVSDLTGIRSVCNLVRVRAPARRPATATRPRGR